MPFCVANALRQSVPVSCPDDGNPVRGALLARRLCDPEHGGLARGCSSLDLPAAQTRHAALLLEPLVGLKVPGKHGSNIWRMEAAPAMPQKPPAGHSVHDVAPTTSDTLPASQGGHASSLVALSASFGLYVPGMHAASRAKHKGISQRQLCKVVGTRPKVVGTSALRAQQSVRAIRAQFGAHVCSCAQSSLSTPPSTADRCREGMAWAHCPVDRA